MNTTTAIPTATYDQPNQHGVYSKCQLAAEGGDRRTHLGGTTWHIELHIAHPGNCDWRYAISIDLPHRAQGSLPSIHSRVYGERQAAIFAAHAEIRKALGEYSRAYDITEGEKTAIREALAWLQTQNQLTLF